jgi:gliding motility associated protien GldN
MFEMIKKNFNIIRMKTFWFNTFVILCLTVMPLAANSQSSIRNQRGQTQKTQQTQTQARQNAAKAIQPQKKQPGAANEEQTQPQQTEQVQPKTAQQQENQPNRRARLQQEKTAKDKSTDLTERARIKNELNSKEPTHVIWLREMYRVIYLDSANNAALKFPAQPVGDRMNLFTLVFKLLAENKIDTYNYVADKELDFSEKEKFKFEEFLKNYQIPYTVEGTGDNAKYKVEEIDIPSQEVTEYLIKEGWYFDAATGTYKSQIIAFAPTIVRSDDGGGGPRKSNVCWIPYENIRPYLAQTLIMTSDLNNAMTYTIDDYFAKGMYKGEIIQTVNMRNLTLVQQVGPEPEALRHAQDSIEAQLKGFEQQLWVQPDTTSVADKSKKTKEKTVKTEKPKAAKAEKSTSAPTRSVRRNR